MTTPESLPQELACLFQSHDFATLRWDTDRDFIVAAVLRYGRFDEINWLRRELGDAALRAWLLQHEGGGLAHEPLRYWELILDLPRRRVNQWLKRLGPRELHPFPPHYFPPDAPLP